MMKIKRRILKQIKKRKTGRKYDGYSKEDVSSITDDILNNMDERDKNLQKRCEDLSGASSDVLHYIRTMRRGHRI